MTCRNCDRWGTDDCAGEEQCAKYRDNLANEYREMLEKLGLEVDYEFVHGGRTIRAGRFGCVHRQPGQ